MDNNEIDFERMLRERFFYHLTKINFKRKTWPEHAAVCLELKKIARSCGYAELAKEMHSYVKRDGFSAQLLTLNDNGFHQLKSSKK